MPAVWNGDAIEGIYVDRPHSRQSQADDATSTRVGVSRVRLLWGSRRRWM